MHRTKHNTVEDRGGKLVDAFQHGLARRSDAVHAPSLVSSPGAIASETLEHVPNNRRVTSSEKPERKKHRRHRKHSKKPRLARPPHTKSDDRTLVLKLTPEELVMWLVNLAFL